MVELLRKLVPFAVRVNAAPPAVALAGEMEVSVGTGLLIVKVCMLDVPPPGAGLTTATFAVPALVTSLAAIEAVSWVLLTKVVVRFNPFH